MTVDYMKDFYFRNLIRKGEEEVELPSYLVPFVYEKEDTEAHEAAFKSLKNGEYNLAEEEETITKLRKAIG